MTSALNKIWTCLLLMSLLSMAIPSAAQDEGAELRPVEIEIVKERQITLPPANRLFDKVPPRPVEPIKPEITYNFRSFSFTTPEVVPSIRPLRLKDPSPADIKGGFLSLGYGNYASPYAELFINSKEDKNKLVGAHAFYNSSARGPVDDRNSGSGNSGLSLFAQSFGKEVTFQTDAGYENRNTHFYGYPEGTEVLRDTIRQSYNLFRAGLSISNARNTAFSYSLGGRFSMIDDRLEAKENTVDLNFKGAYKVSEDNRLEVKANYVLINRKDIGIESRNRHVFTVNPYYAFSVDDNFKIQIGGIMAMENDTLDARDLHFYPDFRVTYSISPSTDLVGSLSGGIDQVSLQSLVRENLWLGPSIPIYHTNRLFETQAAINTKVSGNVFASAGFALASLKNLYFFVNSAEDQARFTTVFDDGTTFRTNLFASVALNYSTRTKFNIRGDYFGYNTGNQAEAWHRPGYSLTLSGSYDIQSKIVLSADVYALGNIKARGPMDETIKLSPAFDLNFRAEYFVSDSFSIFLDFNNVTSRSYQLFLNYPVRRFQGMAGITWSF